MAARQSVLNLLKSCYERTLSNRSRAAVKFARWLIEGSPYSSAVSVGSFPSSWLRSRTHLQGGCDATVCCCPTRHAWHPFERLARLGATLSLCGGSLCAVGPVRVRIWIRVQRLWSVRLLDR